jgi:hypothetical protein
MSMRIAVLLVMATAGPAAAQDFPPASDWAALYCDDEPMGDLVADEAGAIDERDIVGDPVAPAGLRAIDADFAYFRLRLDQDPAETNGVLRPFAWGLEIDIDDDSSSYEILILASGLTQSVLLFTNDVTTLENDPTDPADEPPVAEYGWADNGRTVEAGSDFGGDADYFLDVAIPWDDLQATGLFPFTPMAAWAASSTQDNTLDGDFACHDGGGGDPDLDDIVSDPTVIDPDLDSDGDGFSDADEVAGGSDPDDPDSVPGGGGSGDGELEGGGGCAVAGPGAPLPALLALLLLACRRRRLGR